MNATTVVLHGFTDLYDGKYQPALKKIEKYPSQAVIAELIGINYSLRGSADLIVMSVNGIERLHGMTLGYNSI